MTATIHTFAGTDNWDAYLDTVGKFRECVIEVRREFDGKLECLPGCYLHCDHVLTMDVGREDGRVAAGCVGNRIENVWFWGPGGYLTQGSDALDAIGDALPALLAELQADQETYVAERLAGF